MRWTNVAAALAVAGILGLVVVWPLLEPDPVTVPPPVAAVGTPPPAPPALPTPSPTPRRVAPERRRPRVAAAPKVRERHQVKAVVARTPVPTPAPTVAPAPPAVHPPPREFRGIEG